MRYMDPMLNSAHNPGLRDIRPDLRDRLRVATAERDHMRSMIEKLEGTVQLLEQMLAAEERRFTVNLVADGVTVGEPPSEPLPDFILGALRRSNHSKDSLRFLAEKGGYHVDGRSIHATLVNLIRTGKAEEIEDGEFAARE
jgi:plasmid stability protein